MCVGHLCRVLSRSPNSCITNTHRQPHPDRTQLGSTCRAAMARLPQRVLAGAPPAPADDVTLCEVSCRLVGAQAAARTGCAKGLTVPGVQLDLQAIDEALGQHVPVLDVIQQPDNGSGNGGLQAKAAAAQQGAGSAVQLLRAGAEALLSRLGIPGLLPCATPPPPSQLLAWHTCQQVLAVAHASSGAVLLYDLAGGGEGCIRKAQRVLTHQLQQQVCSLAWRPVHCSMLAVGCAGGVALWSLGKVPLAASSISRGGAGAGGGAQLGGGGWVTFLDFKPGCRVTSLSWSPDGSRLAGCSTDTSRLLVWDAGLCVGATLRLGLQPVSALTWSPDGNFLFAASRAGHFHLYETQRWSLRTWDCPAGSSVAAAAWAPGGGVLLLAMSGAAGLVALHLVGGAPSLTEQLLPVTLPGVSDLGGAAGESAAGGCIQSLAWDPSGNRLAVVLRAPHPAAGSIALYSTSVSPVVTCHLIGFIQPGSAASVADGQGQDSMDEAAAADAGTQAGCLQAAFAPAPGKAGALLSVGLPAAGSGCLSAVRNIPMYL